MCRNPNRSGVILIVVAGIVSMLMVLAVAFLSRNRSDALDNQVVADDAQARITAVSAFRFIQESSRLGWEDGSQGSWTLASGARYQAQEGFGWTDIRDGSVGPRAPHAPSGAPEPSWWQANWPAFPAPAPLWWKATWPHYGVDGSGALPTTDGAHSSTVLRWPAPGTVYRAELHRLARPPRAVLPVYAPNPVPSLAEPSASSLAGTPNQTTRSGVATTARNAFLAAARGERARGSWHGMLDPQPAADTLNAFVAGDRSPVAGTDGRTWFRVYRELPQDHNGRDDASWTDPHYDAVPIPGHSVFVVAAGAGGSYGFRFWDDTDPGFSRALEPITASESGLFGSDEELFRETQRRSRVLFFRVEWSALQASADNWRYYGRMEQHRSDRIEHSSSPNWPGTVVRSFAGNLKWIQRLDEEPVRW
ncbi:MAG: hypothetical protein PF961_05965 [Planctomycetota bacterium]|jgi:type II secretory pathway pseudopilin PulG|nr:hypothetical protein [Planctomycetota bacterium]